jgi:hypothetical protein
MLTNNLMCSAVSSLFDHYLPCLPVYHAQALAQRAPASTATPATSPHHRGKAVRAMRPRPRPYGVGAEAEQPQILSVVSKDEWAKAYAKEPQDRTR